MYEKFILSPMPDLVGHRRCKQMALVGTAFGSIGSLAFGASPSTALRNGAIIGAVNGLYQGHKKGKLFQWGGGSKRRKNIKRSSSLKRALRSTVRNTLRSRSKRGVRHNNASFKAP
jgi:hypothetical protein